MNLQEKMDDKSISILGLSKLSCVCRETIRDILNGKRTPHRHTLSKLAKALNCSIEELKGEN